MEEEWLVIKRVEYREGGFLLTTPSTLSIRVCFFVTQQLDRVDFVMGFVVQLVMEFVEIGNRGDVHG